MQTVDLHIMHVGQGTQATRTLIETHMQESVQPH